MDLIPSVPESVLYKVGVMLASGFHPLAVKQQILREEGVQVDLEAIIALDKTIEKPDIPSITTEFGKTVINDPLEEARKALVVLGARIARRLETERAAGNDLDPRIDSMLLKYYDKSSDLMVKMQAIGVNPWADRAVGNTPPANNQTMTLGEMLQSIRIERPNLEMIEGETREL